MDFKEGFNNKTYTGMELTEFLLDLENYKSPYAPAVGDTSEIIIPLIRKYSLQSSALSSTLGVIPGVSGLVTVIPEIILLLKLQSRMIKDIAILHGKENLLTKELLLYCLFKDSEIEVFQTSIRMTVSRIFIRPISLSLLHTFFIRVIQLKSNHFKRKKSSFLISFISGLSNGVLSFIDTQMVGTTANLIFLSEIQLEPSKINE